MKVAGSFFGWLGRGFLKILKFLLFKLGLWVPAAYSLLFAIVTAVTRTSFSSVWGVYVFGLCVTCVFAVALACLTFIHRADKKKNAGEGRSAGYVKEMSENSNNVQFVEGAPGGVNRQAGQPAQPVQNMPPQQNPGYVQADPNAPAAQGQPYRQPYPQNLDYGQPQAYQGYGQYAPQPQPAQPYGRQPYQPQPQPAPQLSYDRNQNGFDRGYNGGYSDGFNRGDASGTDFSRSFDRNGGNDRTLDGKTEFFSYNVDREPSRPEYTGGDPGFLSYYPERDAETSHGSDAFDDVRNPDGDFARRDRDFSRDSGFSVREDFSDRRDRDFTARDDFSDSSARDFGRGDRGASEEVTVPLSGTAPEKPAIFRTRMEPNLLIYEYSDRLEFYRVTASGPVRVSVEYKNPGGNR